MYIDTVINRVGPTVNLTDLPTSQLSKGKLPIILVNAVQGAIGSVDGVLVSTARCGPRASQRSVSTIEGARYRANCLSGPR